MKWHELSEDVRASCVKKTKTGTLAYLKGTVRRALVERLEARCDRCRYFEPFPSGNGLCGNGESMDGHVDGNFMCAAFERRQ